MSESLHQELTHLRDVTKKAVAELYKEQERLFRDGETMQVRLHHVVHKKSNVPKKERHQTSSIQHV